MLLVRGRPDGRFKTLEQWMVIVAPGFKPDLLRAVQTTLAVTIKRDSSSILCRVSPVHLKHFDFYERVGIVLHFGIARSRQLSHRNLAIDDVAEDSS